MAVHTFAGTTRVMQLTLAITLLITVITSSVMASNGVVSPLAYDSSNVDWIAAWPFASAGAVAVDVSRSVCYLGSGGGVYVLDISNPTSPQQIGEIRTWGVVQDLFLDASSQCLFISADDAGLEIWDVSTASSPEKLIFFDVPGSVKSAFVSDSYLYIAAWGDGLWGLISLTSRLRYGLVFAPRQSMPETFSYQGPTLMLPTSMEAYLSSTSLIP